MPVRRIHVRPLRADFAQGFAALRTELHLPSAFPADVLSQVAAAGAPDVSGYADETDLGFLTIDPPGSMDLDQAMHLSRDGDGFVVRYAIADVGAFVAPGTPLDRESHARGETLYFPDERVPLYPPDLSEGAASLLPDQVRPSVLWTLHLDAAGELVGTEVRRAIVRSVSRLDYAEAQRLVDTGAGPETLMLLKQVGVLRQGLEVARGAVRLDVPEQEVQTAADGTISLAYRAALPAEGWNEQISLLTGMAAAGLMVKAKVGLLRSLPPAPQHALDSLRRSARALGFDWPQEESPADFIRGLDPSRPRAAALLDVATSVLRGAGYVAFDGSVPAVEARRHSAIGADYAHATAPLRRLADRYVSEVCLAICAGSSVPGWARDALPRLPEEMAVADRLAHSGDRAVIDYVEAALLAPYVGQEFTGVVVEAGEKGAMVQLADPAVRARLEDRGARAGEEVTVRLDQVDVAARRVVFTRRTSPA